MYVSLIYYVLIILKHQILLKSSWQLILLSPLRLALKSTQHLFSGVVAVTCSFAQVQGRPGVPDGIHP